MLVAMRPALVIVLGGAILLSGCSLSPKKSPGVLMVANELGVALYDIPPITLGPLADGQTVSDFLDQLAEKAEAGDHDGVSVRLSILSSRVVRVERTEGGVPISTHLAIYQEGVEGTQQIKLQPLIAWRPRFGGGDESELLSRQIAGPILGKLRTELRGFAAPVH